MAAPDTATSPAVAGPSCDPAGSRRPTASAGAFFVDTAPRPAMMSLVPPTAHPAIGRERGAGGGMLRESPAARQLPGGAAGFFVDGQGAAAARPEHTEGRGARRPRRCARLLLPGRHPPLPGSRGEPPRAFLFDERLSRVPITGRARVAPRV